LQNLKFRLAVEGLDERCLPSVTPDMVHIALVHQEAVRDELRGVVQKLNEPKTAETLAFLPTHLRERADSSQVAYNVLATHLNDLQNQVAANPALAGTLSDHINRVAMAEYQASVNFVYAEFLSLAYGAPARTVTRPPSIDDGVNFGSTSLPFSLTDPAWQTVANGNGVRIWDVTAGTGTTLAVNNTFTASYIGYLTDGTVFDSGTLNNTTLNNTNLIRGFVTGLTGMQVGGNRRIDIPASEAYGANPPSGIPVNARLVFDVTLISVTP
jgi:FKBP-type peptidyl-prolyl cis-trans isomerase FkpA